MYNPKPNNFIRNSNNFVTNNEKTSRNLDMYEDVDHDHVVQFRPHTNTSNHHDHDHYSSDNSGVNSPPLWKNISPPKSPSYPLLGHNNNMSPNSRIQAITRGQWELMEMVKNMPESTYELSLKDLVEHHHRIGGSPDPQLQDHRNPNKNILQQRSINKEKSFGRRDKMSFENKGMFLNMGFFPGNWKTTTKTKKKKSGNSNSNSGKVFSGGEKDWWKKKWSGSSDSSSGMSNSGSASTGSSSGGGGGGSTSSGGSYKAGGRKRNGLASGCWLCFKSRRSKSSIV